MQHSARKSGFLADIFGWAGLSHQRALALLALLSLIFFLPGFFNLQPMDRDEPRFAQASKQMLETGDFISIRFQDEARNKKPVGIYWLQAGAVELGEALGVPQARQTIWLYRLPSLLAAICSVGLTYWAALAVTDRRKALIAAMLLASCLLLGVEARLGKTDAVLTATVIGCFGALMRLYLRRRLTFAHVLVFWLALAIGILVKGPLTPLFVILAVSVLSYRERSVRWLAPLRPGLGLVLCLTVVVPWFVMIGMKTHGAFFSQSIGQDMMGKVAQGQESHGAPPLTYFLLFWLTAWPLAPLALLAVPEVWRQRYDPKTMVLLAWLLPAWIMFEVVPTKLPHYVLPFYPAIAILAGANMDRLKLAQRRGLRILSGLALYGLPVALILAALALWMQTLVPVLPIISLPTPVGLYGLVIVGAGIAGIWALYCSRAALLTEAHVQALGMMALSAACFLCWPIRLC